MNESRDNRGRARRPGAKAAERLLDGTDGGDRDPGTAGLAHLLAAAARPLPGRPDDERAVLDAFRASARTPPGPDRPAAGARDGRTPRRRRSVRVLAGGVVLAFALGGAALAAQTGALPHPFGTHRPGPSSPGTPTSGPSVSASGTAPGGSGGPTAGAGTPPPSTPPPMSPSVSPPVSPSGSPASRAHDGAGAKGLCEAYVRAAGKGKSLDPAALLRLAHAAGGEGRIPSYCARLTGSGAPAGQTGQPPSATEPPKPAGPAAAPATPGAQGAQGAPRPSPAHTGRGK